MRDVYRRNSNPSHKAVGGAAGKSGLLGARVNELIAFAVTVTVRRDGGITVHTANAVRAGASREEIAGALGTAIAVNVGAALVYSGRAMDAFAAKTA